MIGKKEKFTILIVDDSFTNRALLHGIFEKKYNIVEAENGVIALEKLKENKNISIVILDIQMPELDGFGVMEAMKNDKNLKKIPVVISTVIDDEESQLKALDYGAVDILIKPIKPRIALHRVDNIIMRREAEKQAAHADALQLLLNKSEIDEKTGLYNKQAFCRKVKELIMSSDEEFLLLRCDVDHFKVFNDIYGLSSGDDFLLSIGEKLKSKYVGDSIVIGRWQADHFVFCVSKNQFDIDIMARDIKDFKVKRYRNFEFNIRVGVFEITDKNMSVELMADRASLALKSIKGSFETHIAFYSDSMRIQLLEEQGIVNEMDEALETGQFHVYLQPQYDYSTNEMIGAEALVRWIHPTKGMVRPDKFIPVFEHNGFITKLDMYICEEVCKQQRKWLDNNIDIVPISINLSRVDIFYPNLVEDIVSCVKKYNIPFSKLQIEITESAYMENAVHLIEVLDELRVAGFHIEMDDFGSGYSSLNTLKNVPVDKLKLDIKFLEAQDDLDEKGGIILSSVVRMASLLELPVIADGVETIDQAEYLKSIGCFHIQGYLFARPMPFPEFENRLINEHRNNHSIVEHVANIDNTSAFLSPSAQTTLLFNSHIGGVAIVEYDGEKLQTLRVNDTFCNLLKFNLDDTSSFYQNILEKFDARNKTTFVEAIKQSLVSNKEIKCRVSPNFLSENNEWFWYSVRLRPLAKNENRYLFFMTLNDISDIVSLSEKLSGIISSVPGGIMNLKIDASSISITYVNETISTMFGYSMEEYTKFFKANPFEAIHSSDKEKVSEYCYAIFKDEPVENPITIRHKDKNKGWRYVKFYTKLIHRNSDFAFLSTIIIDVDYEQEVALGYKWRDEKLRILNEVEGRITFDYIPETDVLKFSTYTANKGHVEETIEDYVKNCSKSNRISKKSIEGFTNEIKKAATTSLEGLYDFEADLGFGLKMYRAHYMSFKNDLGEIKRIVGRVDSVDSVE